MTHFCDECGMQIDTHEFHPYVACLMFKACGDRASVQARLAGGLHVRHRDSVQSENVRSTGDESRCEVAEQPSVFAKRLKALLDGTTLYSRKQWCNFLGVNEHTISKWLEDRAVPRADLLRMVLNLLQARGGENAAQGLADFEAIMNVPAASISPIGGRFAPNLRDYVSRRSFAERGRRLRELPVGDQIELLKNGSLNPTGAQSPALPETHASSDFVPGVAIHEYEQMRVALLAWYEACDETERKWAMKLTAPLKELLRRTSPKSDTSTASPAKSTKEIPAGNLKIADLLSLKLNSQLAEEQFIARFGRKPSLAENDTHWLIGYATALEDLSRLNLQIENASASSEHTAIARTEEEPLIRNVDYRLEYQKICGVYTRTGLDAFMDKYWPELQVTRKP